ncbi:Calcineurin-like phosphoesterase [compost metagenome]
MQYPCLVTSDLHLDAHSSAEYRWGLFPWLNEQVREERAKTLLILGDLTDKKDNHGAEFANRVVRAVASLECDEVKILAGNHDWQREGHPFFRFLNCLPNVEFIAEPREDQDVRGQPTLYLPYSRQPIRDWAKMDLSHYRHVFMHQTAPGSVASNGQRMDGDALPDLSAAGKVYSGDIHVPQVIGSIEYIGSPYHVHFGDDFKPRCVLLERGGKATDLHFPAPRRVALRATGTEDLAAQVFGGTAPGDHVKVRLVLAESERHEWVALRRQAVEILEEAGVENHGVSMEVDRGARRRLIGTGANRALARDPAEAVLHYVRREELGGDALDAGLDVLEAPQ